jgi:hypothetical protein
MVLRERRLAADAPLTQSVRIAGTQEACRTKPELLPGLLAIDINSRMASRADVRRIALSLPETVEATDRFAFSVRNKDKLKGFAWVWMERVIPKKPRVPNHAVLAVRVANLGEKDALLSAEPAKFFTEPHYSGFPAVLVRLSEVSVGDLRELLRGAWRSQAPTQLLERESSKRASKTAARATRQATAPPRKRRRTGDA